MSDDFDVEAMLEAPFNRNVSEIKKYLKTHLHNTYIYVCIKKTVMCVCLDLKLLAKEVCITDFIFESSFVIIKLFG